MLGRTTRVRQLERDTKRKSGRKSSSKGYDKKGEERFRKVKGWSSRRGERRGKRPTSKGKDSAE